MARLNKVTYRKGQMSFPVDRHPGRPAIVDVLGRPLFGKRAKRFVSANAGEDYRPTNRDFAPTDAPPGSIEKIMVLMERVAKHQPLWHPDDNTQYDKKYQHILKF